MRLHIREMGGGHRTTEAHVAGRTMLAGLASFENHYKLISYLSLFFKSLTFFPLSTFVYFFLVLIACWGPLGASGDTSHNNCSLAEKAPPALEDHRQGRWRAAQSRVTSNGGWGALRLTGWTDHGLTEPGASVWWGTWRGLPGRQSGTSACT